MKKNWLLPALCAIFAVICGGLRGYELYHGFETVSGLAITGSSEIFAVRAGVVCSAVILLLLSLCVKPSVRGYGERFAAGAGRVVMSAGGLLMIGAAVFDALSYMAGAAPFSRLILAALSLLSGAACLLSLISYSNPESEKLRGFFSVVPVFMYCYLLVLSYRDLAPEPSVETYLYNILGISAVTAAIYYAAAHAFEMPKPRLTLFLSSVSCVLLSTVAIGYVAAYRFYGIVPYDTGVLGYYIAGAVWAFGATLALCREPAADDSAPAADAASGEE